ncbi:MAG: hypothetical protein IJ620_00445 [Bacteroidales bacterium]|nr:hypothetical protein [Bacteroidales bacterium]
MKYRLLIVTLILTGLLLTSCSNKGVRMPKHRKRTHCDCPTFSQVHNVGHDTYIAEMR